MGSRGPGRAVRRGQQKRIDDRRPVRRIPSVRVRVVCHEQDRDLCFRPISTWRSRHTAHTGVRPKREWVTRPSGPARHDDPPRIRVWTMDAQEWPQGHKRSKSSSEKREAEKDRKLSTKLPGHDVVVTFTAA
nr:unnamed protein product [Haemonchus contortus]